MVVSFMAANVLNFIFNAYLGRSLTFTQFGLVTFVNTITYILNIVLVAVAATIINKVAYINAQQGPKHATLAFRKIHNWVIQKAVVGTLIFIALAPVFTKVFHIHTVTTLLIMSPAILAITIGAMNRAYLQGRLLFVFVGITILLEPVIKLFLSFLLIQSKQLDFVYAAIPMAGFLSAIISVMGVSAYTRTYHYSKEEMQGPVQFSKGFFIAAFITGLANNLFLTFDVLLVKHFFSPVNAGVYSLLSLVGKMVYFFGSILTSFMMPFISADLGAKRNPEKTFNILFAATFVTVIVGVTGIILLGQQLLPLAFGQKVETIFPFMNLYAIAIGGYTLASSILTYHLARKHYTFSAVSFGISFLLCLGVILFHNSIGEVVTVIFYLGMLNLFSMVVLHIIHAYGVDIVRNIIDFVSLFLPLPPSDPGTSGRKILVFNWRDTKHVFAGGAEVYIHELAKRWVKKGHKVTWFCGNDQKSKRYEVIDGIEIIRRGGFNMVYVWAFLYYIFRFRGKYDTIIDCQNGIPFFTPLYAKEKVFCVLFHVHQKVFRESLSLPKALIASYLEANIMPWAYRNVEFITISKSTKKDMEKIGMGKAGIHIVTPGVDTSFLVPGERDKKPLVVFLGRLKKYKSVDTFLHAAPHILKKIKDVRFVIAGDGEEKKRLRALARSLNIENKVEFTGKITPEEKRTIYQRAWLFVNPSMMEGWAITNIEASACGTPVIAADVPGMRDSVKKEHMGFLVPHGNIQEITDKVVHLILDERKWKNMSRNAVEWAKKFEWKQSANKSLEIMTTK